MRSNRITAMSAFLAVALSACAPGGERPSAAAAPVRLRVMSYNLRVGKGGGEWDGKTVDLEPAAKVIEAERPDLVGLQEVDFLRARTNGMDQPAWMAQRLGMHTAFVPALFGTPGRKDMDQYGVALLSRFRFNTAQVTRRPLFVPDPAAYRPEVPDRMNEPRVLMGVPVDVGGSRILVFNTHLALDAGVRERQIREVLETVSAAREPVILTGDFNTEPEAPAIAPLYAEFTEVMAAAGVPRDARNTTPAGLAPRKCFDHIFVSRHFRVLSARAIRDGTLASDHNPIVADLQIAESAKAGGER